MIFKIGDIVLCWRNPSQTTPPGYYIVELIDRISHPSFCMPSLEIYTKLLTLPLDPKGATGEVAYCWPVYWRDLKEPTLELVIEALSKQTPIDEHKGKIRQLIQNLLRI